MHGDLKLVTTSILESGAQPRQKFLAPWESRQVVWNLVLLQNGLSQFRVDRKKEPCFTERLDADGQDTANDCTDPVVPRRTRCRVIAGGVSEEK